MATPARRMKQTGRTYTSRRDDLYVWWSCAGCGKQCILLDTHPLCCPRCDPALWETTCSSTLKETGFGVK